MDATYSAHAPPEQLGEPPASVMPQVLPHMPQLSTSLIVLVQAKPPAGAEHIVGSLGGHTQSPLSHIIPDAVPEHGVPSVIVGFVQLPETHMPATWHWSCAVQASDPVQTPLRQA